MSKLAKQIIKKYGQTQTKSLDLGNCGLTDLGEVPELFELTDLEELYLCNESWDTDKGEWKENQNGGDSNYVTTITPAIARLSNLKRLYINGDLWNPWKIKDISYLKGLKSLISLDIGRNILNDISFVEGLQELVSLDVYHNQIQDITPLKSLRKLSFLDLYHNQIQDITPLEGLTHLVYLDLNINRVEEITPLQTLERLEVVNLGGNKIQIIDALHRLKRLKALNLNSNLVENITPLKGLMHLSKLNLSGNEIQDISCLQDLPQLTSLDLRYNKIRDISCLKGLPQLTELNLSGNKLDDISCLKDLPQLTQLHLSENKIEDITPLQSLRQLSRLYLNGNQIRDISCLKKLTQLSTLNLSKNEIRDISCLQHMLQLVELNLGNNKIQDITPLENLSLLTHLSLSENTMTDIASLQHLRQLTRLYLSGNKVEDLTPLRELSQLVDLDLRDNRILYISLDFLHRMPALRTIYLWKNPIQNVPQEIFDQIDENVLEEVLDHLESIAKIEDQRELNEAKLLIVGVGEVGKTELAEAISTPNYAFVPGRETTRGIRIKTWKPNDCIRDGEVIDFTANIWDFAGQEINYGTHQFFLTKNSVYVFVWETRKGEDQSKFAYWLNIVSLLSENAPVLVVQNKIDVYESEINQKEWKAKFDNIVDFYKISCKKGIGIAPLQKNLKEALMAIPNTREIWNKNRFAVREELEQHTEDYISYREYLRICNRHHLTRDQAGFLSRQLHDIGVILHFGQDIALKDTVVLKPEWATNAAYYLLDNKKIHHGKFHLEELDSIWEEAHFVEKHSFLLKLMERFELVFPLQNSEEYIIPELLPIEAPTEVSLFLPDCITDKHLRFEYHYKFMPKGIFSRFICRVHELIQGTLFWKYGVILKYEESQAQILLNDVEAIKVIRIETWGAQADTLLSIIRMHLGHIHQKLHNPPLNEKIPCVCPTDCDYQQAPYLHDYQTLKKFQAKGKKTRECAKSAEDIPIASLLKGILDTKQETTQQLFHLIDSGAIRDFFEELNRLNIRDHSVSKLRKRYIDDGGDFQYADQLKVWVMDYFR